MLHPARNPGSPLHCGVFTGVMLAIALLAKVGCSEASGSDACAEEGGRCVLGAFINCLKRGSADCNPARNPGGAFCCVEEPAVCAGDGEAATLSAKHYDQTCQVDSDCIAIAEGNACHGCSCRNAAINRAAEASYRRDVDKIGRTMDPGIIIECSCPADIGPCCLGGMCRADPQCMSSH